MINVNSTVEDIRDFTIEEIREFIDSDEYNALDWRERVDKYKPIIIVALANNEFETESSKSSPELDDLVDDMRNEGFGREVEDGGRWSNYITEYFEYDIDGEKYYVALEWEQAATEMQEHGTSMLYRVEPREKTVVTYVRV